MPIQIVQIDTGTKVLPWSILENMKKLLKALIRLFR